MKDYYAVLAVSQDASSQQIRARFLELARKRHPDLFSGPEKAAAEEEFQNITEAFNVLSNPDRRRQHDIEVAKPETNRQVTDNRTLARSHLQRGTKAYKERDFATAVEFFDRATKIDPTDAEGWYRLALASSQSPKFRSQGLTAIAKACEIDKMNGKYFKQAGKLFAASGMPLRAERYYRQALKWLGDDAEIQAAIDRLK